MDGGHMESDDVFQKCDRDPTASDSGEQRGYAAPDAGERARRIGFGSWRDPYRTTSRADHTAFLQTSHPHAIGGFKQ